jgi:hypothetical protein
MWRLLRVPANGVTSPGARKRNSQEYPTKYNSYFKDKKLSTHDNILFKIFVLFYGSW